MLHCLVYISVLVFVFVYILIDSIYTIGAYMYFTYSVLLICIYLVEVDIYVVRMLGVYPEQYTKRVYNCFIQLHSFGNEG